MKTSEITIGSRFRTVGTFFVHTVTSISGKTAHLESNGMKSTLKLSEIVAMVQVGHFHKLA